MRIFCVALIFSALLCRQVSAQSCAVIEYTTRDGLPTGVYTCLFQERAGYLWVGTYANGVARFDGRKWVVFTTKDGLHANKIDYCWEDDSGRMWFDHGQHGMSMLDKQGVFHPFPSSKNRQKEIERNAVSPGGQIYFFNHQNREISRFDAETGRKTPLRILLPVDTATHSSGLILKNDRDLEGATFIPNRWQKQKRTFFKFTANQWRQISKLPPTTVSDFVSALDFPIVGNSRNVWVFREEEWQVVSPPDIPYLPGNKALSVSGVQYVHTDPFQRRAYITWKLPGYLGAPPRYLLTEYDAAMQLRASCVFATYHLPAQVMKDRAGTYWIASETALLRVFPQMENVPMQAPHMLPQVWTIAQAADGQMWFASYGKGLARFDGLDVHPQPGFLRQFTHYDNGSLVDTLTGNMLFNLEGDVDVRGLLSFDGKKEWRIVCNGTMATHLSYDRKGQLMRGTFYKGLWILPKGANRADDQAWYKIDSLKGLEFRSTIHTALEDTLGRYWMGHAITGLACYDPRGGKIWNWTKERSKKNYGVMSMAEDARGNLWLGTDQGLRFLELPEKMDSQFDVTTRLRQVAVDYTGTSLVSVCRLYDTNTLIIGNTMGFFLLDLNAFYSGKILIRSFMPSTGHLLGSINQNGIWEDRQKRIWLTCSGGVTCFAPTALPHDTTVMPVILDSIQVDNGVFKNLPERFSLQSGRSFLKIYFHAAPNPMLFDNICFEYRFEGDSTWIRVPAGEESLTFQNLKEGKNYFYIRTDKGGIYSKATVQLIYVPYWWQSLSLWLAILLATIGVILIRQRIKLQKARRQIEIEKHKHEIDRIVAEQNLQIANHQLQLEKSDNQMTRIEREKNKLQIQAIVNQLNPHFINNALHWLQGRLGEDDEAVRVVGKLSENIGTVFNNSRKKKSYHSLREEIKLAENYLYIQKCRFKEKLHYEIPHADVLAPLETMLVPLMVVQIHTENAIEHGIRNNRTGAGRVSIQLHDDGDYVVITIEDDGVGRAAAKKIGSAGTQQGVKMLKELELIYNQQNAFPLEQYYEDDIFVDADGRVYGTRVVVRLPKRYNFEL